MTVVNGCHHCIHLLSEAFLHLLQVGMVVQHFLPLRRFARKGGVGEIHEQGPLVLNDELTEANVLLTRRFPALCNGTNVLPTLIKQLVTRFSLAHALVSVFVVVKHIGEVP